MSVVLLLVRTEGEVLFLYADNTEDLSTRYFLPTFNLSNASAWLYCVIKRSYKARFSVLPRMRKASFNNSFGILEFFESVK